jgi:antitoxin FitA
MAQILVRGIKPEIVKRLKAQAKRHGRSLESEARTILESGTKYSMREARDVVEEWQKHWGNRTFSDSAELIREDRER